MARLRKTPFHLPYNPDLIPRAKALRQDMTPAKKSSGIISFETYLSVFCGNVPLTTLLLISTALPVN